MQRIGKITGGIIIIMSVYSFSLHKQQDSGSIRFHKIEFTASSINLIEWNTSDTLNTAFVKEWIDSDGRTNELRFYNYKNELDYAGSGFYGGPIVKYTYRGNQIIETFYSEENEVAHDFKTSEVPYRFIYHLGNDQQITKIEQKYRIEFEWSEESLNAAIEHLEFYKAYASDGSKLNSVFGYTYAYGKMNGHNPQKEK